LRLYVKMEYGIFSFNFANFLFIRLLDFGQMNKDRIGSEFGPSILGNSPLNKDRRSIDFPSYSSQRLKTLPKNQFKSEAENHLSHSYSDNG